LDEQLLGIIALEEFMNDIQADLEKQVANLTLEVARLRRSMFIGFVVLGTLLAVGFIMPALLWCALALGILVFAVAFIGAFLGTIFSRSPRMKRYDHVA
jgi:4-hydroxybenzoate polyprenyltransferase